MSYFVIGVGGTGAKFMQTLVHLSAAGLLPDPRRELNGLLVDPDDANGNVDECKTVAESYNRCAVLQTGDCDLFNHPVRLTGAWSPIRNRTVDSLNEIFQYKQRKDHLPFESDLLELMYSGEERTMSIHQGFRGRPAIGSAVLSQAVNFTDVNDVWFRLIESARGASHFETGVPILLAGSVFGGSGAAGVPTILQLLEKPLKQAVTNLRVGLMLFLPYFKFDQIKEEKVQADPAAFALATAEALKYYDQAGFASKCASIYAIGEEVPAVMARSAVGAALQRNEPHFLELIAGMGAIRFFGGGAFDGHVSFAGRAEDGTLKWSDLPTAPGLQQLQIDKLHRLIRFAVAFHLRLYPFMMNELNARRDTTNPLLKHCVFNEMIPKTTVMADLANVDNYVTHFLTWLLRISIPRGRSFEPGLVDPNVFAELDGSNEWVLRTQFRKDRDFQNLLRNAAGRRQPDLESILAHANGLHINDVNAKGTGRLIRAIYDSCEL